MKPGDRVIYFQPNGFDTPRHRLATVEAVTFGEIDGHRAHIAIDAADEKDSVQRDWVRQSSLQPYSAALWDAIERWHEQQRELADMYLRLRKGKIPTKLAQNGLL